MKKDTPKRPLKPKAPELERAHKVLCYAHDTVESLRAAFNSLKSSRGGAPTDEQQDLLRASLVFACAGFDAMTKHLIRATLGKIIASHDKARRSYETWAHRRATRADGGEPSGVDVKFIMTALLSAELGKGLHHVFIEELTAASLQSAEELARVVNALGMDPTKLPADMARQKQIFSARNKIVHEMDIDFDHPTRNRRTHQRDVIGKMTSDVLSVGDALLRHADEVLAAGNDPSDQ